MFNTNSSTFTQVTTAADKGGSEPGGHSGAPSINGNGTRIAFNSSANLTGGNADRNVEIFLFDAVTNSLTQVTNVSPPPPPPPPPPPSPADVRISKSDAPDPVRTGRDLTYTIRVENLGPGPAINLVMSDPLPLGTIFVSASATRGTLTTPPPGSSGTVTCRTDQLGSGESLTVTLVVNVTARGNTTLLNAASVAAGSPDPNTVNNRAMVSTSLTGSPH